MLTALTPLSMGTASSTSTTVPLTDLTTGKVDGAGAFDVMMEAINRHLTVQFDQNRITGKEYASVYAELVPAVLAQSVQFLAAAKNIEKTNAEIALVRQQAVTELMKTCDTVPDGLGFNNTTTLQGLLKEELAQLAADLVLTEQKTVTELAQTGDTIPDDFGINLSTTIAGITGTLAEKSSAEAGLLVQKTATEVLQADVVSKNILKVDAEIDLLSQKTATEVAQTADSLPSGVGLNISSTISGVLKGQVDKLNAEVGLLEQKSVTELVQTSNTIPGTLGFGTNTDIQGVALRSINLTTAQTDGFARDAEQRAAKIVVDPWVVRQSTDGEVTTGTGLDNASVGEFIAKLKAGIGA